MKKNDDHRNEADVAQGDSFETLRLHLDEQAAPSGSAKHECGHWRGEGYCAVCGKYWIVTPRPEPSREWGQRKATAIRTIIDALRPYFYDKSMVPSPEAGRAICDAIDALKAAAPPDAASALEALVVEMRDYSVNPHASYDGRTLAKEWADRLEALRSAREGKP